LQTNAKFFADIIVDQLPDLIYIVLCYYLLLVIGMNNSVYDSF